MPLNGLAGEPRRPRPSAFVRPPSGGRSSRTSRVTPGPRGVYPDPTLGAAMSCVEEVLQGVARVLETEVKNRLRGFFGAMLRHYLPQTWVFRTEDGTASLRVDEHGAVTVASGALAPADVTVEVGHDQLRPDADDPLPGPERHGTAERHDAHGQGQGGLRLPARAPRDGPELKRPGPRSRAPARARYPRSRSRRTIFTTARTAFAVRSRSGPGPGDASRPGPEIAEAERLAVLDREVGELARGLVHHDLVVLGLALDRPRRARRPRPPRAFPNEHLDGERDVVDPAGFTTGPSVAPRKSTSSFARSTMSSVTSKLYSLATIATQIPFPSLFPFGIVLLSVRGDVHRVRRTGPASANPGAVPPPSGGRGPAAGTGSRRRSRACSSARRRPSASSVSGPVGLALEDEALDDRFRLEHAGEQKAERRFVGAGPVVLGRARHPEREAEVDRVLEEQPVGRRPAGP